MKLGNIEPMQPSAIRQNNGLIIVTMGPSGAGKTTLIETLYESHDRKDRPDYTPICLLDIDGKAHVLRDNPLLSVYSTRTWEAFDASMQALEAQSKLPHFMTIVLDGVALLQINSQIGANVFKTDNPQVRMSRYGNANINMISLASRLRTISERGVNVILNIWSVDEKQDDTGVTKVVPDVTPTLVNKFLGQLDFVVYVECDSPNPYPPIMRTGGSGKYWTRTAVSPESPLYGLPDKIYRPSYTTMLDAFHGYPFPTERHKK